ncbi:MAG TPA: ABC transporter permease [Solirubrobacteraceae bacterium]|jgi:putative ABC transport system permease protein
MSALVTANLARRWGRTALTGLGVALGVTTIVALLALTGGLSRSAGDLAKLGRADFGVFQAGLADLSASSLPASVLARVERLPGVAAASPVQILPDAIAADRSILLFGAAQQSFLSRRLVLVSGRRAQGEQLLLGEAAAARLYVSAKSEVDVLGRRLPVAGVFRSGISLEDSGAVLPLNVTQRLSARPGEISMIAVSIAPGFRESDVQAAVERAAPGTLALGDPREVARVDTNSRLINKAAIIIAALALALGAVVVINTVAMAMIERRTEFGVLAAVGWTRPRIARLIVTETVVTSAGGAGLGLAAGVLASELLVRALTATTFVTPAITAWVLGRGALVGFAFGVLAAAFCVWQVMRVPVLKALQR